VACRAAFAAKGYAWDDGLVVWLLAPDDSLIYLLVPTLPHGGRQAARIIECQNGLWSASVPVGKVVADALVGDQCFL